MARQISKTSLDKLFGGLDTRKGSRPKSTGKEELAGGHATPTQTASKSFKSNFCTRLDGDVYDKIRSISHDNGWSIRSIVKYSLEAFVTAYEKKKGPVCPRKVNEDINEVLG